MTTSTALYRRLGLLAVTTTTTTSLLLLVAIDLVVCFPPSSAILHTPGDRRAEVAGGDQRQRRRPVTTNTGLTTLRAETDGLSFVSEIHVSSDPLPSTDKTEVYSFFASETCRNHFLSGGNPKPVVNEPRTPELEACWEKACHDYYGAQYLPGPDDQIISTETSIQFPGLRLINQVFSGVKQVVVNHHADHHQEYNALLIAEKRRASGPPPLVWIYNQLTGSGGGSKTKKDEKTGESSGYALTRIYVTEDDNGSFKIAFDCKVQVFVKFPKFLIRILPTSKERMEEQGSAAVQKAVSKEVMVAVETTNQAFEEWKSRAVSAADLG